MISSWTLLAVGSPPDHTEAILESIAFWKKFGRFIELGFMLNFPSVPKENEAEFIYDNSWGAWKKNILFWADWENFSPGIAYRDEQVIVIYTKKRIGKLLPDILIHEFGHTFGLGHCKSLFCVMSKFMSPGVLPWFRRLCGSHRKELESQNDALLIPLESAPPPFGTGKPSK